MDELKNPERQLSSIAHMVSRGAEIHPDRIAIDDLLRGCRLTYLELDRRISQLARALLGLGRCFVAGGRRRRRLHDETVSWRETFWAWK